MMLPPLLLPLLLLSAPLAEKLDVRTASLSALSAQPERSFAQYRSLHRRPYAPDSAEAATRFAAFKRSLSRAVALAKEQPTASFGLTQFADELPAERSIRLPPLSRRRSSSGSTRRVDTHWDGRCTTCLRFPELAGPLPSSLDWVAKGAVSSVKVQGGCGGCYAFAAAAVVEGATFMAGRPLQNLSVQQIVSCDHAGTDGGCGGSVTSLDTFAYVASSGGLTRWEAYPFTNGSLHDDPANCSAEKLRPPFATVAREWRISGIGHLNDTYPGLNETFPGRGGSRWSIGAPGNAVNESRVLEVQPCHASFIIIHAVCFC